MTIALNEKTLEQIKSLPLKIFIPWDEMAPVLEKIIKRRPDELLEGIILSDKGIHCAIDFTDRRRRKRTGDKDNNNKSEDMYNPEMTFNVDGITIAENND